MGKVLTMSIRVRCTCGKSLLAPETAAGKRLKCPACASLIQVPEPDLLSEEPSTPTRKASRKPRPCPACQAELLGDSSLCLACGWDTGRNVRLCPQCRFAYRVSATTGYTYSAGVVAISVGVKTACFGFAGGFLGDVAWALAVGAGLGSLSCASGLFSTAYACPMCHEPSRARLSRTEARALSRQRAAFGAGLAACVVGLLLMVGWYRSLRRQSLDASDTLPQVSDATSTTAPTAAAPKPARSDTLLHPGADHAILNVDNPSPSAVQVVLDGQLRWEVSPWGASTHTLPAGKHTFRVEPKGSEKEFTAVEGRLYIFDASGRGRYVAWEESYARTAVETWGEGNTYWQNDLWGRCNTSTAPPSSVSELPDGPWFELEAHVPVGTEIPSGFQIPAEDPRLPGGKCKGYLRVLRRKAGSPMSAEEADALLSDPKAADRVLPGWEYAALDAVAREVRTAMKHVLPELSISTNDERWRQREAARKALKANAGADWIPALLTLLAQPPQPYGMIHPDAQRDIVEVVVRLGTPADLATACASLAPEVRKELLDQSRQLPWATARGVALAALADSETLDAALAALARSEAKGDREIGAPLVKALERCSALARAKVIAAGLLEGADLRRCCDLLAGQFGEMLDHYAREVSYVLGSAEALTAPEADGLLAAMAAYPRNEPQVAAARIYARRGAALEAKGDDAEAAYAKALELNCACEAAVDWQGMRAWRRGDFEEAWERLQAANPINGAEDKFVTLHLWALLARKGSDHSGYRDLATKLAVKCRAAKPGEEWVDLILAFAAGEVPEKDLLAAAEEGAEGERPARRCQACFYIAYGRLAANDVAGARNRLAEAVATKARVPERAVAAEEAARIGK